MGSINFSNALGIHANAMQLRAQRAEVLANNLANSDTPGFKARDFDFKSVLQAQKPAANKLSLATSDSASRAGHLPINANGGADAELLYRTPSQPAIDGNTVDSQIEQAMFARNSLDYNASFEFLNGKFKGLKGAIRGE